jgi:hypothetical protein
MAGLPANLQYFLPQSGQKIAGDDVIPESKMTPHWRGAKECPGIR